MKIFLIQTIRISSKDIGMKFGIKKHAMLKMKKGQRKKTKKQRKKWNCHIGKAPEHLDKKKTANKVFNEAKICQRWQMVLFVSAFHQTGLDTRSMT